MTVPSAESIIEKTALVKRLSAELEADRTAFIRYWRGVKGWSIDQIAAATGVPRHGVTKYMEPHVEVAVSKKSRTNPPVSIARTSLG